MNKKLLLIYSAFCILHTAFNTTTAQILCVFCYDQNDSISSGVNNYIVNGGFENTTCGFNSNSNTFCPNSSSYNCDIANWTCTGGGSATYTCFYDGTYWYCQSGTHTAYFGNSFCQACSAVADDTSCLAMTNCTVSGIPAGYPINGSGYGGATGVSLEQTVNGLTIGSTYVLEFWTGGECLWGSGFPDDGIFGVDIGFGYNLLRCPPTGPTTGIGRRFIIEFNATSTSHTVKFTNWGHICTNCTELLLDDVRLYTLAELNPIVPPCGASVPVSLFTAPNHICPGTCIDFTNLSTGANSYQWSFPGGSPSSSTDVNPQSICFETSGQYDVTLIASNGTNSDTLTLGSYITVYPNPAPPSITQVGDTLVASQGYTSYQWYFGSDTIPGATNYNCIATQSGNYNLIVTDTNGCKVGAGIINVISGVAHSPAGEGWGEVFPNPAKDNISISIFNSQHSVFNIQVYNSIGEEVYNVTLSEVEAHNPFTINTTHFSNGIYLLKISSEEKIFTEKIVIEK